MSNSIEGKTVSQFDSKVDSPGVDQSDPMGLNPGTGENSIKRYNTEKQPANEGFNKAETVGKTSYNKHAGSIPYDASSVISRTSVDDDLSLVKHKNSPTKQVT